MPRPLFPLSAMPPACAMARAICMGWIAVSLGCTPTVQNDAGTPRTDLPTREAVVLTVQLQQWPLVVRSQGTLMADEVTSVGAKVAGSVSEVYVDLGDLVHTGEPLVALDQEEFRLEVDQAEAQLAQARSAIGLEPEQSVESLVPESSPPVRQERALWDEAKANLERVKQLQKREVITQVEFDQIVAAERVAEARYAGALNAVKEKIALIGVREVELSLARERLRDALLAAPFDALVQQRHVAPGAYVQVGDPIATLVRTDPLRFRGTVPERHAQNLAIGQEVRLKIEGIAQPRPARVTRISPALDQSSRALMFEAEIDNVNQELRTGLFAEAEVVVDPQAEALVVPHSAVVEFAGAEKVWKVVDGVAGEQEVLTGQRRTEGIEILSGLAEGDIILQNGDHGGVARIKPPGNPHEPGSSQQSSELTGRSQEPPRKAVPPPSVSG